MKEPLILLIDGECVLCHRVSQFVIRHDPAGKFRFAALQSEQAGKILRERGQPPPSLGTFVLIAGDAVYYRSEAAFRTLGMLPFPWGLARCGLRLPRPLRDFGYFLVARTRLRLFGSTPLCGLLTSAERERFLTEEVSPS